MKIQHQILQDQFKPGDGFIKKYQKLVKDNVIPYQYNVLWDKEAGNSEKSHVVANFINAGKVLKGEILKDGYYGMVFQDSDAAKWIEAAAFSLVIFPDEKLEKEADELIDIIASAQDSDGYLNTYYTIKDKDKRWTNLQEGHELYCSGHMMEAACAYAEATGKKKLLSVMEKNLEHIYSIFMNDKDPRFNSYPGHPEIELALMKMYRSTGNPHALELSKHFINMRGKDPDYFRKEAKTRGWTVWGMNPDDLTYAQNDKPVRELSDATGHAVRAVYLYTGMADIAGETGDEKLKEACERLWDSITKRRMYVTGGIGSTGIGEAFTVDYNLPSDTAYCETCASIGLMFFASRMLETDVDSKYSDIMEKAFYNTVLAGMQLDGKRFFYVNPLETLPGITGTAQTHRHVIPVRPTWYACACCPPNAARLISSIGKYAYGENSDTVYCHLFAEGSVSFKNGIKLACETKYPYGFTVEYKVSEGSGKIAVRIPFWSKEYTLLKNGEKADAELSKGYAYIEISAGDTITLKLCDKPYFVYPSPKIADISNCAALCRGPFVYCAEGADNNKVIDLKLDVKEVPEAVEIKEGVLKGITVLKAKGSRSEETDELYSMTAPEDKAEEITFIPYYSWCNRGLNEMRVWLPRK